MQEGTHPDLDKLTGPDRRRPGLGAISFSLAVVVAAAMVFLWPRDTVEMSLREIGVTDAVYRAEVSSADVLPCSFAADLTCSLVVFTLLEGPTPGTIALQEFEELPSTPRFEAGETVVLNYLPEAPAQFQYQYADRDRRPLLVIVTLIFAAAVVGLGRMRGLAALAGLAASILILLLFIVPAILSGRSPVLVATVGAAAIAFLALYLAHGITALTHVALIGTFASLVLTVALSAVIVDLARFSGFAAEESLFLTLVGDFDMRGMVLAGIVLGALGALDDVTVTQASTVWELRRANPELGPSQLMAGGLRVGRDHIASTVNTLLLAYAGAAMPLLLLLVISRQGLGIIANGEVVAVEIVRTLVGSIGLVAAVPITTWLAAMVASGRPPEHPHGR